MPYKVESIDSINEYILPQLIVQRNETRLLDYKKVIDFNQEMLCLKMCLNLHGKELTEDDIIQNNISLFYIPANTLMN